MFRKRARATLQGPPRGEGVRGCLGVCPQDSERAVCANMSLGIAIRGFVRTESLDKGQNCSGQLLKGAGVVVVSHAGDEGFVVCFSAVSLAARGLLSADTGRISEHFAHVNPISTNWALHKDHFCSSCRFAAPVAFQVLLT